MNELLDIMTKPRTRRPAQMTNPFNETKGEIMFITGTQALAQAKANTATLQKQFAYDRKYDTLTINVAGFPYEIPMDEIRTHHDLIGWVRHMSEKNWITTEHIRNLIECVCAIKNWPIN